MNLHRLLLMVGGIALIGGLILVFVIDGETGWFGYGEPSDHVVLTEGTFTIITDRERFGFALVAVAAMIGAGLVGHRIGARRAD